MEVSLSLIEFGSRVTMIDLLVRSSSHWQDDHVASGSSLRLVQPLAPHLFAPQIAVTGPSRFDGLLMAGDRSWGDRANAPTKIATENFVWQPRRADAGRGVQHSAFSVNVNSIDLSFAFQLAPRIIATVTWSCSLAHHLSSDAQQPQRRGSDYYL